MNQTIGFNTLVQLLLDRHKNLWIDHLQRHAGLVSDQILIHRWAVDGGTIHHVRNQPTLMGKLMAVRRSNFAVNRIPMTESNHEPKAQTNSQSKEINLIQL